MAADCQGASRRSARLRDAFVRRRRPTIFPQHVLLSGARAGQICFFWRESSPQILLMRSRFSPFNVFIYHSQWPCSVLKCERGGGNGKLIHTSIVFELQMRGRENARRRASCAVILRRPTRRLSGADWRYSNRYERQKAETQVSRNYSRLAESARENKPHIPSNQHGQNNKSANVSVTAFTLMVSI